MARSKANPKSQFTETALQDGMLAYLKQNSDMEVEKRLEQEPFDLRDHVKSPGPARRKAAKASSSETGEA